MTTPLVSWWRVTQNIFFLTLRELLNKGTYLVLGIVIARRMGHEAFGHYTLSLLLSRGFFTIGDVGFGVWLVREVAQVREAAGRYFGTVGILRVGIGLGVLLCLKGFLLLSDYAPSLQYHIWLSGCGFFFIHLMSFVFSFFRAFEKMESELAVSLVKSIVFVGGGIWAVFQNSLDLFFGVFVFSSIVALLVSLFLYGRQIGWKGMKWIPIRLEGILSIWLIQSVVIVYLYIATLLLSFFRGISDVGLYQAAYSFIEVIFVLSTILTTAFFPVFSRLARHSPKDLLSFYEEIFRAILLFFVPCAILALFGAESLLEGCYGSSFRGALPALYLLLSGSLLFIFGGFNSHLLIAMGKEKFVLGAVVFCTCLNLFLNVRAIPQFGVVGAGFVMVACEIVMFSLMMNGIIRHFKSTTFLRATPLLWIQGIWVLFLFSLFHLAFWVQCLLGFLVYGLLVGFFQRKLSKELHAVKVVWKEIRDR